MLLNHRRAGKRGRPLIRSAVSVSANYVAAAGGGAGHGDRDIDRGTLTVTQAESWRVIHCEGFQLQVSSQAQAHHDDDVTVPAVITLRGGVGPSWWLCLMWPSGKG